MDTLRMVREPRPTESSFRVVVTATGEAEHVPLGRLAAVLGTYDVEAVSYRKDPDSEVLRIRIETFVPDPPAARRLQRRLLRCVGIREVAMTDEVGTS